LVRRGYDALSYRYRADDAEDGNYGPWLAALRTRIPAGAAVLDLGCGNGIPVARHLAAAGHAVTGVDISQVQTQRARRLVPAATFLHADITRLTLPAAAFDAVVCLYALIHLPLDEQPPLLSRIAGWLRPGGWLLATTGHQAWTGVEDGWLGGTVPCGGATPTQRPIGCGWRRPTCRSPPRTSSPKAPAVTPCSGPAGQHLSACKRGLVVADPLIEPDEHLAGFLSDDGGLVVSPGEAADGIQVIEKGQGHELGLLTDCPPQQPRSPKSRYLPQGHHDLGAIVLLIAIRLARARPASPHSCDHHSLLWHRLSIKGLRQYAIMAGAGARPTSQDCTAWPGRVGPRR
jgi:SAM-dependent methyltransferase